MAFRPRISAGLQTMDVRLFEPGPLGLREQLLNRPLVQRFELDAVRKLLHIDFSGLKISGVHTIDAIEHEVRRLLAPLGERVEVIVNYDHFTIAPELADAYAAMVQALTRDHYAHVKRYGTVGFLKSRLL
jgi:propionate CoA-transferase